MFFFVYRNAWRPYPNWMFFKNPTINKKKKYLRTRWIKSRYKRMYIHNYIKKYRWFWEKYRKNLNDLIKFRAPTQEKKTKYFSQFRSKTPAQIFNMFNHNLFSILNFANFFYTKKQIHFFIKQSFFYKNGSLVNHKDIVFSFGDRLNVIFSKRYYFYSLFIMIFFKKKLKRLGYYVWKYVRYRFNRHKRQPRNPHKYFEKYIPFFSVYPTFLEIDYKSLTVLWVLPNKNLKNINGYYLRYINYYFFRLYNWKYII